MLKEMSKIDINLITRGRTSGGATKEVVNTIRDCYKRFGSKSPYKIDILVAETQSMMQDFLKEENFRFGITSTNNESSICSHDALRGHPRITVSLEGLAELSKLARLGAIRHEAAHSVLHCSLEFGIFRIPEDSRQIAFIKGIELPVLEQVIYTLASAIMDYEASHLLVEHDYIECQAAFALETEKPPKQDKSLFNSAKTDRQARFIFKTALLQPMLFAYPLLELPKNKKISLERQILLGRRIEELVELVDEAEQNRLLQVSKLIADNLTSDTHHNVDSSVQHAISLA
jgi:hypothetical protein